MTALTAMAAGPFIGYPELLSGLVAAPLIAMLVAPLISKLAAREARFDLSAILWAGLGLKFLATVARYLTIYSLYDGGGDAATYDVHGSRLAASFRELDFVVDVAQQVPGTGFLRYVTGVVYVFTFDDQFAGFLVFAAFTFVGVLAAFAAVRTALPDADHRLYVSLVMLWPSLLFWPASIGKDSWMILAIGLTSWGAAKMYTRERGGFFLGGIGLLATAMLRPHVTLLLFVAMFVGYLLRPGRPRRARRGRAARSGGGFAKVLGVAALLVVGSIVATETEQFFEIGELSTEGVNEALAETSRRSSQGGGGFTPVDVSNPVNYPWAAVTVLFRPFPFEAHNAQALASSIEGIVLLGLLASSRRALLDAPRMLRRRPFVAYSAAYTLMFVYAFAAIGNFGILSRQRSQLLPLVFVFVVLPKVRSSPTSAQPADKAEDKLAADQPQVNP
ncbi:MAG TPA: hypothetical protein DCS55_14950 [Acidimicrobiaceae bacterium]|nr:hypothetical protein [Acidimicrobiaceae bacterium]